MLYLRILIISQLVLNTLSACDIEDCLRCLGCCKSATANCVEPIDPVLGGLHPALPKADPIPAVQQGMFIGIADELVVSSVSSSSNPLLPDRAPLLEKTRISLQELRLLIVEDNPLCVRILTQHCLKYGLQKENIEASENGKDGVEAFKETKPHLIFMDRNMPVKNGIEATREIRLHQETHDPIIICISDDASESTTTEFTEAGANGFFHKPFIGGCERLDILLKEYFEFVDR